MKKYSCTLRLLLVVVGVVLCHHINVVSAAGNDKDEDDLSRVEFLPGFNGRLPFELFTGYIGVSENEEVQLFYYFIKSESNPKEDPLILWLSGGPGCSSLTAFMYELGPLEFKVEEYNGSLPTLLLAPHSMSKVANVLFLDQPANTGFSYATTPNAARFTDLEACNHVYDFLQKGYILGNPVTFPAQKNYSIPFAHGMGLVSSELYKSIAENCKEEFEFEEMDGVKNDLCSQELKVFKQMISGINPEHVLEPVCESQFILLNSGGVKFFNKGTTRSLSEKKLNMQWCRGKYHDLSTYWANDISVQEALHVRKGSIEQWLRCRSIIFPSAYTVTTRDSRQYHANLSRRGYASLIFR
ncbi:unnamed protein product [Cuscuta epithymum]|uniref:Uncharacterized protein n=1 Tax=Cuscuta epithymum TaxID=186058 RepID=A0AAV0EDF4_9ASTE|nr:unnamed protein product [Cuscuta epithymum]